MRTDMKYRLTLAAVFAAIPLVLFTLALFILATSVCRSFSCGFYPEFCAVYEGSYVAVRYCCSPFGSAVRVYSASGRLI